VFQNPGRQPLVDLPALEVVERLHEVFQVEAHRGEHVERQSGVRADEIAKPGFIDADDLRWHERGGVGRVRLGRGQDDLGETLGSGKHADDALASVGRDAVHADLPGLDDVKAGRFFALAEEHLALGQAARLAGGGDGGEVLGREVGKHLAAAQGGEDRGLPQVRGVSRSGGHRVASPAVRAPDASRQSRLRGEDRRSRRE